MFPKTARLRVRLLRAGPRRKMDCHARVARIRSKALTVLAPNDPPGKEFSNGKWQTANFKTSGFGVRGLGFVKTRAPPKPGSRNRIPKPEPRLLPFALCHLKFSFRPLHPQHLARLQRLQLVNQKFSIRCQGNEEMGQRRRGRSHDLGSLRCELAPV